MSDGAGDRGSLSALPAALTPDEIRRADPAIDCPFCKTRVLVKRRPPPEPALVPMPIARPVDFVVVEHEVRELAAESMAGDGSPYRTAPAPALDPPTFSVTWREQRALKAEVAWFYRFTTLIAFATVVAFIVIGRPDQLFFPVVFTIVGAWLALANALNKVHLEAGRDMLDLHSGPIGIRHLRLSAADVRQLFVVERSTRVNRKKFLYYVLYARDRRGRDHRLATLDDAEAAWWLEERLERHLGIVDQPVTELEHRRPMQLAPGSTQE